MQTEDVRTDVLCIGAGIAGLMASIRAAELGAKVILIDKAIDPEHSGSAGLGNDHFQCYIPEVHGTSVEPYIDELQTGQQGALRHRRFIRAWLERSFEMVTLWDEWGIPMKYNGQWEFAGHTIPGKPFMYLHYEGRRQKKRLIEQAVKRGVEIRGGITGYELLVADDRVIGAIGLHTRQPKATVFEAPAVILGTGACTRIWPASTPAYIFNTRRSPITCGDGRAMAYRAGAELVSMEEPMRRCGPKYLSRAGKATWAGVCRDWAGNPVGPFVDKPNNVYGDPVVDIYQGVFAEYASSGKGPIYMDCNGLSEEELAYMRHWMSHEGFKTWFDEMEREKLDFRKNGFEFWTYEFVPRGGVYYNEHAEASLKGLYACGDEWSGGISGAAVFGWIAGERASAYARGASSPGLESVRTEVAEKTSRLDEVLGRKRGAKWKEANIALNQLMNDYCGATRSERSLSAGLLYVQRLKDKVHRHLMAGNPHELLRAIEVLNLIDLGEVIMTAARERRETRGAHQRADFRFTNPMLTKLLLVKQGKEGPEMSWREIDRSR